MKAYPESRRGRKLESGALKDASVVARWARRPRAIPWVQGVRDVRARARGTCWLQRSTSGVWPRAPGSDELPEAVRSSPPAWEDEGASKTGPGRQSLGIGSRSPSTSGARARPRRSSSREGVLVRESSPCLDGAARGSGSGAGSAGGASARPARRVRSAGPVRQGRQRSGPRSPVAVENAAPEVAPSGRFARSPSHKERSVPVARVETRARSRSPPKLAAHPVRCRSPAKARWGSLHRARAAAQVSAGAVAGGSQPFIRVHVHPGRSQKSVRSVSLRAASRGVGSGVAGPRAGQPNGGAANPGTAKRARGAARTRFYEP